MPVPHSPPWLRFQSPLSEPSRRIYRTRLSSGIMRLAHGTPWQPRTAGDLAKVAQLPPCGARRVRWAAEPVDASTTPRLSSAVPSLGHVMLPGSPVFFRGNRHSHSRDPSPFGHRSSPEAPSLRRRYPASQVIWASPPPCRPDLTLAGCRLARATPPDRASRVASIPLFHACCRHYPGGTCRCVCRSLSDKYQPSPFPWRVGFRITRFEACSAFTRVAARMVAEPPLAARCIGVLQTTSLPPSSAPTATGWSDSCRAGFAPAEEWRLPRRTQKTVLSLAELPPSRP